MRRFLEAELKKIIKLIQIGFIKYITLFHFNFSYISHNLLYTKSALGRLAIS